MNVRIARSLSVALVCVQLLASVVHANPRLGGAADILRRVPAEERAKIESMLPRMSDDDVRTLSQSLREYDQHSTFWNSLKWATSAGAMLTPFFGAVGIVGAGKLLGGSSLAAMAWGGPAIWAIGAAAGGAAWVGLHYYNHTKHWQPKALAKLSSTTAEIESRTQPAQPAQPAAPVPTAPLAATTPSAGISLLGIGGR